MKKTILLFCLIFLTACSKPYSRPPGVPVEPGEEVPAEYPDTEAIDQELVEETPFPAEGEITERILAFEEEARGRLKDVLFDYDRYNIRPDAVPVLRTAASFLKENRQVDIVIEGHCDERGTNEYNLALGEKRARAVKDYLVSLGVSPDRLLVLTYGEEKPLCSVPSEACWQRNRRAHFVIARQ